MELKNAEAHHHDDARLQHLGESEDILEIVQSHRLDMLFIASPYGTELHYPTYSPRV